MNFWKSNVRIFVCFFQEQVLLQAQLFERLAKASGSLYIYIHAWWLSALPVLCLPSKATNHKSSRWWQLKHFLNFHPEPFGEMIQFDDHIFQMGGSTTNYIVMEFPLISTSMIQLPYGRLATSSGDFSQWNVSKTNQKRLEVVEGTQKRNADIQLLFILCFKGRFFNVHC